MQSYPLPTLASTLYSNEKSLSHRQNDQRWRTGVKVLDRDLPQTLFGSGTVVGFSGVGDLHRRSLRLIHNLIVTHLLDSHDPLQPLSPSIFIVEPPTTPSNETSLLQIYEILESRITNSSRERKQPQAQRPKPPRRTNQNLDIDIDIDTLIDRISILPYFDLIGVSQALSEINDSLQNPNEVSISPSTSPNKTIILLRGLTESLVNLASHTSSTSAQPFALLTEITRQLRRLSRIHIITSGGEVVKDVLVLVELGDVREVPMSSSRRVDEGDILSLRSAFSSRDGRYLRMGLGSGSVGGEGGRRDGFLVVMEGLARLLWEKLDVGFVVHGGFGIVDDDDDRDAGDGNDGGDMADGVGGKYIVEVMKDRVGGGGL